MKVLGVYFTYVGGKNPWADRPLIFVVIDIRDLITCFKFGDDRFRGLASDEGQILPFPIDFDGRPYNTLTLPCERVIEVDNGNSCSSRTCVDNIVKKRQKLMPAD